MDDVGGEFAEERGELGVGGEIPRWDVVVGKVAVVIVGGVGGGAGVLEGLAGCGLEGS